MSGVRLDKWLWAARFFKTRSQAKTAVEGGTVHLNGARVKAAKDVRVGDELKITRGAYEFVIAVERLSDRRGNATSAQTLYTETTQSVDRREAQVARRRMERAGLRIPQRRPSKKDRRDLRKMKTTPVQGEDANMPDFPEQAIDPGEGR